MVHSAGRYLDLSSFDAKNRTHMFAVRTLHFHVLFDLRSIDHGDYLLPLMLLRTKRRPHGQLGNDLAPYSFHRARNDRASQVFPKRRT